MASPKKRTYVKKEKSETAEKTVKSPKRTKIGRPLKQENVTKKVMSIFQSDDLAFFLDSRASPTPELEPRSPAKPAATQPKIDNTGDSTFSHISVISGIASRKVAELKDLQPQLKFVPMPVPKLDADGNIADPDYVKNHLSGIAVAEDNVKLIDERAFFLEGAEGYFEQHNLRFRPAASGFASHAPSLEYEEFLPLVKLGQNIHGLARTALFNFYGKLYHQWAFEVSQGYSLLVYGVGSKVNILSDFLDYLLDWMYTIYEEEPVVFVINGYNPGTKLKVVISDIITAVEDQHRAPKYVSEAFPYLMKILRRKVVKRKGHVVPTLVMIVHNIDGPAFRDERSQNYLSQLAALPNVTLLTSTDNINCSLLWDLHRFKNFNFLWHNTTTYEPYTMELLFKDVLTMGQSKKFVGVKGVKYVLSSLSDNARKLYFLLLKLQMKQMEESTSKRGRTGLRATIKFGIPFRDFYDRCVEEYITSNEMNLRNMLGEYVEHKMCVVGRNQSGKELVHVPFTYDELGMVLAIEDGYK